MKKITTAPLIGLAIFLIFCLICALTIDVIMILNPKQITETKEIIYLILTIFSIFSTFGLFAIYISESNAVVKFLFKTFCILATIKVITSLTISSLEISTISKFASNFIYVTIPFLIPIVFNPYNPKKVNIPPKITKDTHIEVNEKVSIKITSSDNIHIKVADKNSTVDIETK